MSRDDVLSSVRPPPNLQIDYARQLNEQQYQAVTAQPGPALVIAGAGSGKTRTLTYRVAWLIEHGVPPDQILLLTFTNKAAREMMSRVTDLLGAELRALWGGTFHSIGARILRRQAQALGLNTEFSIMDREDSTALIKVCLTEAKLEERSLRFPKADVLAEIFSLAQNTRRSLSETLDEDYTLLVELTDAIAQVNRLYTEHKRAANLVDFDDLLSGTLRLLQEHEEIREHYQQKFHHLLVDEYQDTNKLQSELIDLLGQGHHNVMVVGDDAQSIYAWRGAEYRNILEFPQRYPGCAVYKIETNYRSTPEILALANAAIAPNLHQFAKELKTSRRSGQKPLLLAARDSRQQAACVAHRLIQLRDEGVALGRIAILYRSHFHALEFQFEFTRRNIPFFITSGIRFFEQAHVKDVAAYLKLICNPSDELAFRRLVQLCPGVGARAADKLWAGFSAILARDVFNPDCSFQLGPAVRKCAAAGPKKAAAGLHDLVDTLEQLEAEGLRDNPEAMLQHILEAGYEDYLQANYTNYRSRLDDLEQLAGFIRQFPSTQECLTQLALLSNLEAEDDPQARNDPERVRLSTIHQAKGLEWDVVFLVMLCDGLFPSKRALESEEDNEGLEEERRLFYVAITRARDELYLSYPSVRAIRGSPGGQRQLPSRFLKALPPELLDACDLREPLSDS